MTRADKFEEVFGYRPATDQILCNEHDWCGENDACNYCMCNPNSIGRAEDYWNAEYFDVAINALEQEPILDKIRAEIIQSIQNGTLKIESGNEELFRIIDKRKAESEG